MQRIKGSTFYIGTSSHGKINEKHGFLIVGVKYMIRVKEIKSDFPGFNLVSSMLEKSAARKLEERVDDVDATVESDVAADMVDQLDDISLILIADSVRFPELKETFQRQKQLAVTDSKAQQQRSSLAGSFGASRVMDSQFHVVAGLSVNGPNSPKDLSFDSDILCPHLEI
ncbi:unnamed protein product [Dovyalis caffra]|uniref:Uncharacterized protein n=1 Tax=Dovyalis caffra TaxID=77055 RepID=A0AAV1QLZ6_9ROSI|nr:unnamed protein product [Dovyalis caffra]